MSLTFLQRLRRLFAAPAPQAPPASFRALSHEHATPADIAMMDLALDLARRAADQGEVPVGAVVYHTPTARILGQAANRREADHDPAAHAELIAIRQAAAALGDWRLNQCTLVVTLEPCPMCAGLIVNARLGRLVYAATDPKAGAVGSLYALTTDPRLNHRVTPIVGVRAKDAAELLTTFFKARRTSHPRRPPTTPPAN